MVMVMMEMVVAVVVMSMMVICWCGSEDDGNKFDDNHCGGAADEVSISML